MHPPLSSDSLYSSVVLDWICPKEEAIQPPLHRNSKIDQGFNHELTGSLLCPAGLNWNDLQMKENLQSGEMLVCGDQWPIFLYELKATQSENACYHGMNSVTIASIAYIATQVQFALTSSLMFLRTDTATDSETFYHSLFDLLEDTDKSKEVNELLVWWNQYSHYPLSYY
ncbi:hypothetical protein BD769DRAFT_1625523 [Suillus cothurnatus]|nr:hypothetical protein BD769DRAFT_1625523 [Suillus cothurnatus]